MTTDVTALDWRKMSREEVDRGLNNGAAVAASADIIAGWQKRSAALRQQHPQHLDLRYGPRERNRIGTVARVVRRLTTAGLHRWYIDVGAAAFEQLDGREAHRGPHEIDKTGDEKADAHDGRRMVARDARTFGAQCREIGIAAVQGRQILREVGQRCDTRRRLLRSRFQNV